MTFFFAFIVLDERRIADGRRDCCCCCAGPHSEKDGGVDDDAPEYKRPPSRVSSFLEHTMIPAVLSGPGRVFVTLLSLGLLAVGVYGIIELDVESTRSNFIPDDSYAKETLDLEARYFNDGGKPPLPRSSPTRFHAPHSTPNTSHTKPHTTSSHELQSTHNHLLPTFSLRPFHRRTVL